tara:strand:+ start:425 stop:859 length:435 start_codon:yes stop_codon:yes gene_type:complete
MGVRQGKNYIVSINVTPSMHKMINKRVKGTRSAFVRRAIFNAIEYDEMLKYEKEKQAKNELIIEALFRAFRYYANRHAAILRTGIDLPDFKTWEMMILNYDYRSHEWTVAFDAIEELIQHIEGLNSALHAFGVSVGTPVRDEDE